MQWFYVQNDQRFGPVEEAELFRLAREGLLAPGDLVWNASMGSEWQPAASIPNLFAAAPSGAIAPPPPAGIPGAAANAVLMARARESLAGNWGAAVGATVLYGILTTGISFVSEVGPEIWTTVANGLAVFIAIFLAGPLTLGWSRLFLVLARNRSTNLNHLFSGFKTFGKALGAYWLVGIFIFLWCLLAIVPGIVAAIAIPLLGQTPDLAYLVAPLLAALFALSLVPAIRATFAYSQVFFVLAEDPACGALESSRRSKKMMDGFKWKYFCLGLRFLGWFILGALTCGIGFLWIAPYLMASYAHFYDDVRANA